MSTFQQLVAKLREVFQINRPELDFGIYRILNARAGEINDYLESRLFEKVQAALSVGSSANVAQLQIELEEAIKQVQGLGMSPDNVPKVQELRAKLKEISGGSNEHENAVFSHLLTFFSRYYDNGDFISQRRYKGNTYAIPYSGEEVMLHWANKDQYYTKSGENFANYSFKLEDGRSVHFRLVAADTAKDNRKDNDKERRFVLIDKRGVTRIDERGNKREEVLLPVEEVDEGNGKQLVLRFEYAVAAKGTKQEKLVEEAVKVVLADAAVKSRWLAVGKRAPTEKNPQRTLLEKHLVDYTTKNTADYFIHQDLGGFLRRELDFYVKNEVMHLDDVQSASAFGDIERSLRMIQCLRAIALELIGFLAQLEDFQKKLWLKKKFVVSSHYCLTLDRVPEVLWPDVVANDKQWAQWFELGMRDSAKPGSLDDFRTQTFLMVDTSLYSAKFKAKLLALVPDLDSIFGSTLVNSDNFQALALLRETYKQRVSCIYIDPPYNAKTSEILYKNTFKHSAWATMMANRVTASKALLRGSGTLTVAIDENEQERLGLILEEIFPDHDRTCISVVHNPRGIQGSGFSYTHEYAYFVHPKGRELGKRELDDAKSKPLMKTGSESERRTAKTCFYPILVKGGVVVGFGDVLPEHHHPSSATEYLADGVMACWPISSTDQKERKWRYSRESVESVKDQLEVRTGRNGEPVINLAKDKESFRTVWSSAEFNAAEYGSTLLKNMIPDAQFSFPKSLHTVTNSLRVSALGNGEIVIDYFAGSGTTGHAVLEMNRKDGARRNFILVEQGQYFDLVLKPRVQKAIYSAGWKEGKPTVPETGISHSFKVIKLESYEDTLNNLQLRRTDSQGQTLSLLDQQAKDDYLMHYMLDVESRGSLLSVEDFKNPFDYTLNIAVDSAGAFEPRKIDLVETFNYLIGLRVKHIDAQFERGFATVTGTLPSGETCLVLWRDCEKWSFDEEKDKGIRSLNELCEKLAINPSDNEYDVVYVNGDHNIPTVLSLTAEEGGISKVLKLRQIEPEFLERMFAVEDV